MWKKFESAPIEELDRKLEKVPSKELGKARVANFVIGEMGEKIEAFSFFFQL